MARAPKVEEERPPHDALDGVTLPRETGILIGHGAAERTLLDAYRSQRMHHAWILAGETGIGKATLAFRLARFVFAHPDPAAPDVLAATDLSVPAEHPASHRVAAGVHPNLLHLQREWDEPAKRYRMQMSIEAVRRVHRFLGMTAGEGGWRVVVVDTADEMSISAANAILKNLEEPPRQTLFMLVTHRRGALLPTILSRCRTLTLSPLSAEEAEAVVAVVAGDPSTPRGDGVAAALAGGSPRRLIELRQADGVALYRQLLRALDGGDRQAQLDLSARAAERGMLERFMDVYEFYLDRRLHGLPLPGRDAPPPPVPLVTLAELWEKAALSGREVETYNLDRRQFVLDLLESSAAALRPPGTPHR
jgi:DNA polymerase-3 subunit delta'